MIKKKWKNPTICKACTREHFLAEGVDFGVFIYLLWFALLGTNETHV